MHRRMQPQILHNRMVVQGTPGDAVCTNGLRIGTTCTLFLLIRVLNVSNIIRLLKCKLYTVHRNFFETPASYLNTCALQSHWNSTGASTKRPDVSKLKLPTHGLKK